MYDWIKEQYDNFVSTALDSSIPVTATINVSYTEVPDDSGTFGGGVLDARTSTTVRKQYPYGLQETYRVKVYPIDKGLFSTGDYKYTISAKIAEYDFWVSCFESTVKVLASNKTVFDYAKSVTIEDTVYSIKGLVRETFGNNPILHVFLSKETRV